MRGVTNMLLGASVPDAAASFAYLGASSARSSNRTIPLTNPSPGAGTFLIAVIMADSLDEDIPPSGWASVTSQYGFVIYTRTTGVSEPATYRFAFEPTTQLQGIILAFRDGTFDVLGTQQAGVPQSKIVVAPSVPASEAGSFAVALFTQGNRGNATFSTPAGWSPLFADSDVYSPSMTLFSKVADAGPTGDAAAVPSGGIGRGIQFVVKSI